MEVIGIGEAVKTEERELLEELLADRMENDWRFRLWYYSVQPKIWFLRQLIKRGLYSR